MKKKTHFVYIVQCSDGTYYIGYTTDIARRIKMHNSGAGARYTRGRGPVKLRYQESYWTRSKAQKREAQLKLLTRNEKIDLIGQFSPPYKGEE